MNDGFVTARKFTPVLAIKSSIASEAVSQSSSLRLRRSAAEYGDADNPLHATLRERLRRRLSEADKSSFDTLSLRVWRAEPEHGIGAGERFVGDVEVAMGTLDHLDALARLRRQLRGFPGDDTDVNVALKQVLQNLTANFPRGCCNDDGR